MFSHVESCTIPYRFNIYDLLRLKCGIAHNLDDKINDRAFPMTCTITSVSYTHLDVYKRQAL